MPRLTNLSWLQQTAPEQQAKQQAADTSGTEEDSFDINQNTHKGQFALRRLYHESERLVVVLYTAPSCGPCRTLKPIFNKVVEEYSGKVSRSSRVLSCQGCSAI